MRRRDETGTSTNESGLVERLRSGTSEPEKSSARFCRAPAEHRQFTSSSGVAGQVTLIIRDNGAEKVTGALALSDTDRPRLSRTPPPYPRRTSSCLAALPLERSLFLLWQDGKYDPSASRLQESRSSVALVGWDTGQLGAL